MSSPRPTKRQRQSSPSPDDAELPTPQLNDSPATRSKILARAKHIISTEAAALARVSSLYQTDDFAAESLVAAVQALLTCQHGGGKLVVCGVGKSAYIGMKLVATCKSLGIAASFLHACEAMHGDQGDVRENDVVLFVSFSGRTPELLTLLAHLPESTRIVALSSHTLPDDCPLVRERPDGILLPAPIPETEESSFGIAAPTTSTTVALAVADMLALTTAEQMHGANTRDVFKRNHPGGAIGMNHKQAELLKKAGVKLEVLELPSPSISAESDD